VRSETASGAGPGVGLHATAAGDFVADAGEVTRATAEFESRGSPERGGLGLA
jgi:hypothetical protein